MAKASKDEQSRRDRYYQDIATQLPWEVGGLEIGIPAIDISTSRREKNHGAAFDDSDLSAFFAQLDALERELAAEHYLVHVNPIEETRVALEARIAQLSEWEEHFGALVRKELLAGGAESDDGSAHEEAPPSAECCEPRHRIQQLEAELAKERAAHNDTRWRAERVHDDLSAAQAQARICREQKDAAERRAIAAAEDAERAAGGSMAAPRSDERHNRAATSSELQSARSQVHELSKRIEELSAEVISEREVIGSLRTDLQCANDARNDTLQQLEDARSRSAQDATYQEQFVELCTLARPLLNVSLRLRQFIESLPTMHSRQSAQTQATGGTGDGTVDAGDSDALLRTMREFNCDDFYTLLRGRIEALATLVRKWQKAHKSVSSKFQRASAAAKDRIAFRNFEKGDLALFLPTRNNPQRPWAAFNIGHPHRFLSPSQDLTEYLRTREWVVARITDQSEHIAENDGGNVFRLPAGTHYHMLTVDGWEKRGSTPLSEIPSPREKQRSSLATVNDAGEVSGAIPDKAPLMPEALAMAAAGGKAGRGELSDAPAGRGDVKGVPVGLANTKPPNTGPGVQTLDGNTLRDDVREANRTDAINALEGSLASNERTLHPLREAVVVDEISSPPVDLQAADGNAFPAEDGPHSLEDASGPARLPAANKLHDATPKGATADSSEVASRSVKRGSRRFSATSTSTTSSAGAGNPLMPPLPPSFYSSITPTQVNAQFSISQSTSLGKLCDIAPPN